ncbi:MAG TPA: hypothetical protein VEH76_08750 [Methylocystis sp.]|nr:hypothetical protein [Methylocystis sp.]
MDQGSLVSSGQALVRALDESGLPPRAAMWVHETENDNWRLWLVPPKGTTDRRDFFLQIAKIVAENRLRLGGFDTGDARMVLDDHPAIKGLRSYMKVPGLNNIFFPGNKFEGYYLPEGIILRLDS